MERQSSKLQLVLVAGSLLFLLIGFFKGSNDLSVFIGEDSKETRETIGTEMPNQPVVVIDAGHGGSSNRLKKLA